LRKITNTKFLIVNKVATYCLRLINLTVRHDRKTASQLKFSCNLTYTIGETIHYRNHYWKMVELT